MSTSLLFTLLLVGDAVGPIPLRADAFPPVQIQQRIEHIRFTAVDRLELDRQLRDAGMLRNGFLHGLTRSSIDIEHESEATDLGCALITLRVQIDVTITLPEWSSSRRPRRLGRRLERAYQALYEHEQQHRDQAIESAVALRERLLAQPATPDCRLLQRALSRELRLSLARLRARDSALDYFQQLRSRPSSKGQAPELPRWLRP
jgi:predicted secreted Zn-dependent protease